MDQDFEHRVRERAYQIWEEEGRPQGRDAHHWQQAAAEFAEASQAGANTPKTSAPKTAKRGALDAPGSAPSKRPKARAPAPSSRKPRGGKPTAAK